MDRPLEAGARKFLKTGSGKLVELPSEEEEAAINAGIAADPDTYELSDAEFKQLKPYRGRGRPIGSGKKEQISLRVDSEVLDEFRQSGDGWQTRMNDALKDWLQTHRLA